MNDNTREKLLSRKMVTAVLHEVLEEHDESLSACAFDDLVDRLATPADSAPGAEGEAYECRCQHCGMSISLPPACAAQQPAQAEAELPYGDIAPSVPAEFINLMQQHGVDYYFAITEHILAYAREYHRLNSGRLAAEPVEVTEAMVERAFDAYCETEPYGEVSKAGMRAALNAALREDEK